MKKLILALAISLFTFATAQAERGVNMGISVLGGVFEADGGSEKITGAHSSGASPGNVTKNSVQEAAAQFVIGSVFVEKTLGDRLAIGVDYVPMSMESETSENVQTSSDSSGAGTNTVQVDFEDLTTIYATLAMTDNLYLKVGYVEVDVITNESLATGGSYGNTSLDGHVVGIGYHRDLDTGAFVRLEANFMDLDGATLTNTADSTKSVTADGADGYGAKLSIGKSF
ncbi:hypothetical protein [Candidatus Pelagibacter communis]|uniref:hypothetical protein n=1 Tax=Pelagibacter ubique TaxID=198252 RepID=UPI00094C5EC0|nr:hypothetical protein [Candidatus Pelagibacter ubique]|tara:strand:- start:600 stop:1280 length:681 start_codon:yes stop_codon:yes gene_type:complete